MPSTLPFDEGLSLRLPLPLAQLYRRAHNAKSVQERHHAAFYLWEASLKLLGATAVGFYLASGKAPDAALAERLQNLARPSVGHWWEIVRSEEHTSELQSHSFISYAVFCLKKKK